MLPALCLAGLVASADPAPAPLPDRWLLKLAPADLPELPDTFYTTTWHDSYFPRFLGAWAEWTSFRRAARGKPAEVTVTRTEERVDKGGRYGGPGDPTVRTVPLAVHGPLVEYDGKLYTATLQVRNIETRVGREALYLGSAVELKGNVFYQAGTRPTKDGTVVEEWRLEFGADPRKKTEGAVTVRSHTRLVTAPEGESFEVAATYKSAPPNERTGMWVVEFKPADAKDRARKLPYLQITDKVSGPTAVWVDGQDRKALGPAPGDPPAVKPVGVPELVRPPDKP